MRLEILCEGENSEDKNDSKNLKMPKTSSDPQVQ